MGRHSGEHARAAATTPRPPRRRLLTLSFVVTITLVAWGVLVVAAIDFGREARSGDGAAWTFLTLASMGAAACLFVTMILGARLLALVREGQTPPAQPAPPARPHRPARSARPAPPVRTASPARTPGRPARTPGRRVAR